MALSSEEARQIHLIHASSIILFLLIKYLGGRREVLFSRKTNLPESPTSSNTSVSHGGQGSIVNTSMQCGKCSSGHKRATHSSVIL